MMNYNVGIDSELVERFKLDKFDFYVKKILSKDEEKYFNSLVESKKQRFIASRFSAKEAIFKAFGIGISNIKFQDITILPNDLGKPCVYYNDYNIELSITYCNGVVTTFAIVQKKEY